MDRRTLLVAIMASLASIGGAAPAAPPPVPLTVFAAASLTDAMQAVGASYTKHSGVPVRFSFASSSLLAKQITAGAKADLFVSADLQWMDQVQQAGLIDPASRRTLLRGALVLIAPADAHPNVRLAPGGSLVTALGPGGRLAVGDPDYVPAGIYAKAALTKLGLWSAVRSRLARADNVRVALSYVARHEAPLGIVYETDARAEPGVRVVGMFPESSHPPIDYPVATLRTAGPGAPAFAAYLNGAEARAIFRRFGFRTF